MDRRAFHLSISFIFLAFFLILTAPARAAAGYQVVGVHEERDGPLLITEWSVQDGDNPVDRFTVHRVRKSGTSPRGVLLMMPGGGSKFALYTASESGEIRDSFAGFFALRGFDVWGYSPRTRGLAPGACSTTVDCSAMREWGMQTVVEDALYIREQIRRVHGKIKPVIGGYSLGAMSTLAVINASPRDWKGALLWEGMLYSEKPEVRRANATVCASLEEQIAAGQLWDEATYSSLQTIYGLATGDPDGPSPLPGFEGLTNRQAFFVLMTTPQPAPPGYVPGYTLVAGDIDGLTYSSEERIGILIAQFNAYEPMALIRDYTCALGGERTFTRHLGRFKAPVLAIQAGRGFGLWMDDNLGILGSDEISTDVSIDYAHGDHYASPDHRKFLEGTIYRWLKQVVER
jgi:pimeloyl-ACP methyl ester carboxylesterase